MQKRTLSLLLIVSLIFTLITPTFAAAQGVSSRSSNDKNTADGSYIIKFKDAEKGKQALSKRNKKAEKSFKHLSTHVSTTLSAVDVEELKKDPNIAYIEKDSIVKKTGDIIPDNLPQIHVPEVQSQGIYGDGVKVAILDTGISTQSPELHVAGGASFVPNDSSLDDTNGHGTFLAGILAAIKDDQGLIGVAPNVSLYDVKVLDSDGNGSYSQVIQGIEYAIDNHIDILSMSFAGKEYSAALEEVMQKAYDSGILLIAATGNDGTNIVSYPAKYSSVIAVGAVDNSNQLASFSNTGTEVELVSPGVNIKGLPLSGSNYTTMSGTSMAVPQVAGIAALVKQENPLYTIQQLREALDSGAAPLGDSIKFGHGLVNAAKTLNITYKDNSMNNSNIQSSPPVITAKMVSGFAYGSSVYESVYKNTYDVSISEVSGYPTTYDNAALNNVNLKADQAPFSIGSNGESISILTGELSLQQTDMTLPGRNGLSFSLTRQYNSNDSQFYDMDVEQEVLWDYRVYPFFNVDYQRDTWDDKNYNYVGTDSNLNQLNSNLGFYPRTIAEIENGQAFGQPVPHKHTFDDGYNLTLTSGYYSCGPIIDDKFTDCYNSLLPSVQYYAGKRMEINPDTWYYSPSGYKYHQSAYFSSSNPSVIMKPYQYVSNGYVYNTTAFINKTIAKTYNETMFPIGKGWSWNISSIESRHGKRYLHLAGRGTYEIDGSNQLLGYPWKDITLTVNSSVSVNGETSYYDLKSLDNSHQYFNSEGRLIEIADAYNNTIQFTYSIDSTYGKVLTGITDAIGNTISITYSANFVTLTMGDKKVYYQKDSVWGKEFLTHATDQLGRRTSYNYGVGETYNNAKFNLASNTVANQPMNNPYGLLTSIMYPTLAKTYFIYENNPVTRYFGPSGYNQAYRISQRYDKVFDGFKDLTYNSKSFTYSGDVGSNYLGSYSFSTTVDDGLKQTTYTNFKQYISDTVPASYYTTNIVEKDKSSALQKNMSMNYDTIRHLPVPNTTTTTFTKGASTSTAVTLKRTYDDYGNVTSETDPNNVTTSYKTDGTTHLLSSISQPMNANQIRFVKYDRNSQGSVIQINVNDMNSSGTLGTLRSQTKFGYTDGFGNITTVTVKDDNRDIIINKEYNATFGNAFLTKQSVNVTNADGNTSTVIEKMQYDKSSGNLTQYTDGKGNITSYQYDKLGRVKLATYPDNSQVTLTYDDINNKLTAKDQMGLTTFTKWNSLGWKTSTGISGTNSFITYGYDAYGRIAWSQDAINQRITYGYDAWNRLTQTKYPDNSTASVAYDDINFTKTITDAESNQTRETYDLLNRLTKQEWLKASGAVTLGSYTYNNVGNMLTSTDGNSNTTSYAYDVLSRLSSVTDAQSNITSYAYSLANKLTQTQYADGNKEQKQYDELGRLIKKTNPTGLFEKYYYDLNGNLNIKRDYNGQSLYYAYNTRNFLVNIYSVNESIHYEYDLAGRRLKMSDKTGNTNYSYDPTTKRLNMVTYPDGKTIKYQYDDQGNRTQMTDPFAINTTYGYDVRNRLTGVGAAINNWDASYTYKKNDLLATVQQGNGMAWTYGYDGFNLTSLTQTKSAGAVVNSYGYGYDRNFNQTSKTESGVANSFTYDQLNRIGTSSQFNEQYSYDARGNRQTLQTSNVMNFNGASYTYDDRNRLTQVRTDDGMNVTYRYNGDGLLYERTENGVTTRYYWDGDQMIAEGIVQADGTATLKARYVRGNGLVARVDANGNKAYYQVNGHGDVVGLTDATGNMLNTYSYDIWGNPDPAKTQETVAQPFRYSGEFYDSTTGLQYLRTRWYDPSMGRFINEDTYEGDITNPLSLNQYTYVHNNPLKYADPTGHKVWLIHGTFSSPDKGWGTEDGDFVNYVGGVFNEPVERLEWSGENSTEARQKAADDLSNEIIKYQEEHPDEPIRLVGHSHGGNVSILITNQLAEKNKKVDTLITIATPVREYKLETEVGQRIHVYNKYDAVQVLGGELEHGGMAPKRTFDDALNIEVKLPWYFRDVNIFGIRNHSAMHSDVNTWKKYIEPTLILESKCLPPS